MTYEKFEVWKAVGGDCWEFVAAAGEKRARRVVWHLKALSWSYVLVKAESGEVVEVGLMAPGLERGRHGLARLGPGDGAGVGVKLMKGCRKA